MATAMDRSKYRNPDMPIGYVKKEPGIEYKYGVEIDGFHYVGAPYIYEAHAEEREDFGTLSDLILSDDEVIIDFVKDAARPGTSTSSTFSNYIKKEKKEKETITIKEEPTEYGGTRRKIYNHAKKGHVSNDMSAVDASLSHMDIDSERREKRKKLKNSKRERRSDSSGSDRSPSTRKRHTPPSNRRSASPSSRRCHSPPANYRHCSPSTSYRRRSPSVEIVTYSPSPSPSPERYLDVKVKQEFKQETMAPNHLFGSYICEICNTTMNSKVTYDIHVNGKRHRKNLKVKNVSQVMAQNIPATVVSEDQSKYPKPPPGIIRKKVQKIAEIQHLMENSIKRPCPGLNNVTEIQGIGGGTQYYCSMCDCVCSPSRIMAHLTGYKHQLNSVKTLKPGAYEHMQFEPRFKIENEIRRILYATQKKEGMGRMAVEVEEFVSNSKETKYNPNQPSTRRDYTCQPSTSRGTGTAHSG